MRLSGTALAAALALCLSSTALLAQQKEDLTVLNERLFEAVRKNDMGTVRSLLTAGADPMARDGIGQTPAGIAINQGYFEVAHYILSVRNRQQALRRHAPDLEAADAQPSAPATSDRTVPTSESRREPLAPSWRANVASGQATEIPTARVAPPRAPVVVSSAQPKRPTASTPNKGVQKPNAAPAPSPAPRTELTDLPRLPSGAPNPFDPRSSEPASLPVLGATLAPPTPSPAPLPAAVPTPSEPAPAPAQEPAKSGGRNPFTRLWDGVSGVFSGQDRQESSSLAAPAAPRESPVAAPSATQQEPAPAGASAEMSETPATRQQSVGNGTADLAPPNPAPGANAMAGWITALFDRGAPEPAQAPHLSGGTESKPAPVEPLVVTAIAPSAPAAVTEADPVGDEATEPGVSLIGSIAALFGRSGPQSPPSPPDSANVEPSPEPVAQTALVADAPSEPVASADAPGAGDQPKERTEPVVRFSARLFDRSAAATAEAPHAFETAAAAEPAPIIEPGLTAIAATGPLPVIVDPTLTAAPAAEPRAPHETVATAPTPPAAEEPRQASAQTAGFAGFMRNLFRPAPTEAAAPASPPPAAPQAPQAPVQLAALAPIAPSAEQAPAATSVVPPAAAEPTPIIEPGLAAIAATGPLPVIVDPTLTAAPAVEPAAEPRAPHETVATAPTPPAAEEPTQASAQTAGFAGFMRNLFRSAPAEAAAPASPSPAAPQAPQAPVQLAALAPIAPSAEQAPAARSVVPPAAAGRPLAIGDFTLTRALNDPAARAKNCFQKGKLPGWYCLESIEWPAEVQQRMEVDSWLFGRGRIVVHYDNNGAAQILFALFPTEQFNHIVRFLEAQLGPATSDSSRRVALIGEPAKLNLIAVWTRRDGDGKTTLLEVRKFDTVRSMIPDTRVGFLSLSRDGAQAMFRYVSDADLMMQSMRMSIGAREAPVRR